MFSLFNLETAHRRAQTYANSAEGAAHVVAMENIIATLNEHWRTQVEECAKELERNAEVTADNSLEELKQFAETLGQRNKPVLLKILITLEANWEALVRSLGSCEEIATELRNLSDYEQE